MDRGELQQRSAAVKIRNQWKQPDEIKDIRSLVIEMEISGVGVYE